MIRTLLAEALEAIRKTRQYAGDQRLLDYPGWSWADWEERVVEATKPVTDPTTPRTEAGRHRDDVGLCAECGKWWPCPWSRGYAAALEDVAERVRGLRDSFAMAAERWEAEADAAKRGNHRSSFAGETDLPSHVLSRERMLVFQHVVKSMDDELGALLSDEGSGKP